MLTVAWRGVVAHSRAELCRWGAEHHGDHCPQFFLRMNTPTPLVASFTEYYVSMVTRDARQHASILCSIFGFGQLSRMAADTSEGSARLATSDDWVARLVGFCAAFELLS